VVLLASTRDIDRDPRRIFLRDQRGREVMRKSSNALGNNSDCDGETESNDEKQSFHTHPLMQTVLIGSLIGRTGHSEV
jgi:hypothetical protein